MSTPSSFDRLRTETLRKISTGELTPEQAALELSAIEQAARATPTENGDSLFGGATQSPAGTAAKAPKVGDRVSHFELVEFLGEGGMGTVWKAQDLESDRFVVVKFVLGSLRGSASALKMAKESFQVAHQLRHPALCAMIDFLNDPALGPCVILDYVPGMTLTKYRKAFVERHGQFSVKLACKVLKPIAEALDDAHRRGVIHRDVKPDNILVVLDKSGRLADVKLIDLGVAATVQSTMSQFSVAAAEVDVVGTPLYWAPEQCRGHHPSAQTDQYALAAVAYELLAGHPPFAASNRMQLMTSIRDEFPEPIEQSATVNEALMKGMAKDRKARHENCAAFVEALNASEIEPVPDSSTSAPRTAAPPSPKTSTPVAAVQPTETVSSVRPGDERPSPQPPKGTQSELAKKVGEAVRTERFFDALTDLARRQRALRWSASSVRCSVAWLPAVLIAGVVAFLLMLWINEETYDPPTVRKFLQTRSSTTEDERAVVDEAGANREIYGYYVSDSDICMLGQSYGSREDKPLWNVIAKDFPNVEWEYTKLKHKNLTVGSVPSGAAQTELVEATRRLEALRKTRDAMTFECAKWARKWNRGYHNRPFWLAGFAFAAAVAGLGWLTYQFAKHRDRRIARHQAAVDQSIEDLSRHHPDGIAPYGEPDLLTDPAIVRALCVELSKSTKLAEDRYWRMRMGTAVVAFLLGATGLHKYLTGRPSAGGYHFLMGALWIGLVLAIPLGMIEGAILATMSTQKFYERYVIGDREWF